MRVRVAADAFYPRMQRIWPAKLTASTPGGNCMFLSLTERERSRSLGGDHRGDATSRSAPYGVTLSNAPYPLLPHRVLH